MSEPIPVPIAKVKAMLEQTVLDRDPELVLYEQKLALDHAQRTAKLTLEATEKLIQELSAFENVDTYYAVKLADLLPTDTEDVRAIFQRERYTLSPEEVQAILDTISRYI